VKRNVHDHDLSRRAVLKSAAAFGLAAGNPGPFRRRAAAEPVSLDTTIDIGSRRELFIDRFLIDRLEGGAEQRLHHPTPRGLAVVHDAPWEGSGSGYHSIFQDGDLYRMYYKAWHLDVSGGRLDSHQHPLYCCYAESDDGVHWRKPQLGLHAFRGSKQNNIVIASGQLGPLHVDAGHPAVMKDANPAAVSDARYKALLRSAKPNGLLPFKSPDGIHWAPMTDRPILSGLGAFDSQNLAFWDPVLGKYRAYWRIFTAGVTSDKKWKPSGYRAIRTATSDDLVHWAKPTDLTYVDSPPEHLYTNQVKPYRRAPHLLIGFPTRYIERGWSDSMRALPEAEHRRQRAAASPRYGTAITEGLLMASRDGVRFKRWNEGFLRPGIERSGTWNYGQQYIGWQLVETESALAGAPRELSLYATESYWTGRGSALRRYTLRLDGFVSVSAPMRGGQLLTKPLRFAGRALHVNFATSAAGSMRVELQHPDGTPWPGFSLADCDQLFGDSVDRQVTWKQDPNVKLPYGQPVRLRFQFNDADLYSVVTV